ncbi:MAG: hypothetical protein QW728_03230, partial [Thermoplasmata archaeon]
KVLVLEFVTKVRVLAEGISARFLQFLNNEGRVLFEVPLLKGKERAAGMHCPFNFLLSAKYSDYKDGNMEKVNADAEFDRNRLQRLVENTIRAMPEGERHMIIYHLKSEPLINIKKMHQVAMEELKWVSECNQGAEIGFFITTVELEPGVRVSSRIVIKAFAASIDSIYFCPFDISGIDWRRGEEISIDVHTHPEDWPDLSSTDIRGVARGSLIQVGKETITINGSMKDIVMGGKIIRDSCTIVAVLPFNSEFIIPYQRNLDFYNDLLKLDAYGPRMKSRVRELSAVGHRYYSRIQTAHGAAEIPTEEALQAAKMMKSKVITESSLLKVESKSIGAIDKTLKASQDRWNKAEKLALEALKAWDDLGQYKFAPEFLNRIFTKTRNNLRATQAERALKSEDYDTASNSIEPYAKEMFDIIKQIESNPTAGLAKYKDFLMRNRMHPDAIEIVKLADVDMEVLGMNF